MTLLNMQLQFMVSRVFLTQTMFLEEELMQLDGLRMTQESYGCLVDTAVAVHAPQKVDPSFQFIRYDKETNGTPSRLLK